MIALITLVAPAPSGASRTISALVVAGTSRAPLSTTAIAATTTAGDGRDDGLGHLHAGQRLFLGEVGGHAAQDVDERDHRQRLDEELREGEVGGAVDDEQPTDPVADQTDEQHGRHPAPDADERQRGEQHDHGERELKPRVVDGLTRPRSANERREPGQDDDGDEHRWSGRRGPIRPAGAR